jgi:uncharacterized protein (DUF433 family)
MSMGEKIDWPEYALVEVSARVLIGAPVLHGTRMPGNPIIDNFD